MFYKLMRLFIVVVGCFIGPGLVLVGVTLYNYFASADLFSTLQTWVPFVAYIASGIISGIIFFILSKRLAGVFEKNTKKVEEYAIAAPKSAMPFAIKPMPSSRTPKWKLRPALFSGEK